MYMHVYIYIYICVWRNILTEYVLIAMEWVDIAIECAYGLLLRGRTPLYVWQGSFVCVTWLMHVWCSSSACAVTRRWFSCRRAVTHSMCADTHRCRYRVASNDLCHVYVCVYEYKCIWGYRYNCICVCMYVRVFICVYLHLCIYIYVYEYMRCEQRPLPCVCKYTYIRIYMFIWIHMYMHLSVCMCIYAYICRSTCVASNDLCSVYVCIHILIKMYMYVYICICIDASNKLYCNSFSTHILHHVCHPTLSYLW